MEFFTLFIRLLYLFLITPLFLYALGMLYLLYLYFRYQRVNSPRLPVISDADLPLVTVQLPLFNERYVARRLIDAVAVLDYPQEKLHIQVLDDSTDDTTELLCNRVAQLKAEGINIDLIHRVDRVGYKAGALAEGLEKTNGEFIAIFDADFVPGADFLRKTVPHFLRDNRIGVVQGRWGHLNDDANLLTRSEALMLDGHFAVEQLARSAGGLISVFNGTCGLWRRACIEDSGGWHHDTLTEDSDLSFRAHMRGWKFVFLPHVMVPGEIPAQMVAFKQQQARWAKGLTQVMLKLAIPLMRSELTWRTRIMGLLQLLPYPTQLLGLIIFLLMPLMMMTRALSDLPVYPLGIASMSVPIMYVLSQQALYDNWLERSLTLPTLMILSSGMSLNNSRAVLSAFLGRPSEFKRTPKFHVESGNQNVWQRSQYSALVDKTTIWEILFGIYAAVGAALALHYSPSMLLYFLFYSIGFFSVAGWSIADRIALSRPPKNPTISQIIR